MTECRSILRAESVYTELLREGSAATDADAPKALDWKIDGNSHRISFEWRANAVWQFGRVFLVCGRCERRATRLYVPAAGAMPACRRCWGLTYESREHANYKDAGRFSALGLTHRNMAACATWHQQESRAEAAVVRQAERRLILKGRGEAIPPHSRRQW